LLNCSSDTQTNKVTKVNFRLTSVLYAMQGRRKLPEGGAAALLDQSGDAANIEARKDENSARSAEKNFSPSFSVIRMGSRGTFVLYFED